MQDWRNTATIDFLSARAQNVPGGGRAATVSGVKFWGVSDCCGTVVTGSVVRFVLGAALDMWRSLLANNKDPTILLLLGRGLGSVSHVDVGMYDVWLYLIYRTLMTYVYVHSGPPRCGVFHVLPRARSETHLSYEHTAFGMYRMKNGHFDGRHTGTSPKSSYPTFPDSDTPIQLGKPANCMQYAHKYRTLP